MKVFYSIVLSTLITTGCFSELENPTTTEPDRSMPSEQDDNSIDTPTMPDIPPVNDTPPAIPVDPIPTPTPAPIPAPDTPPTQPDAGDIENSDMPILSATLTPAADVYLFWQPLERNVLGYAVDRQSSDDNWKVLTVVNSATLNFTDTAVFDNQNYNYRLRATLFSGDVVASKIISISTQDTTPNVSRPYLGAPTNVPGRIDLEHYDLGGEGVAYHDTSIGNATSTFRTDDVDIVTGSNQQAYITNIVQNEWLSFSVMIQEAGEYQFNATVASPVSSNFQISLSLDDQIMTSNSSFTTSDNMTWMDVSLGNYMLPAGEHRLQIEFLTSDLFIDSLILTRELGSQLIAPSNLTAQFLDEAFSKGIYLRWQENSTNESTVIVERASPTQDWTPIAFLVPDADFYQDDGATPAMQYSYRVKTANSTMTSEYSNTVSFGNGDTPQAGPNSPSNLTAQSINDMQINIQWIDQTFGAANGFEIERQDNNGAWVVIGETPMTTNNYVDANIANANHAYRARAFILQNGTRIYSDYSATYLVSIPFELNPQGAAQYQQQCASCHGNNGQGTNAFPYPLTVPQCVICSDLNIIRSDTDISMPPNNPNNCSGACATNVAEFIFYGLN